MSGHEFAHFVAAQDAALERIESELLAGSKRTHWMWFVFPQIAGLGHSAMAERYAIRDLSQARRYLDDPVVGARLRRHVELLSRHRTRTAREVLGTPDDLKLRSCLTLFAQAWSTHQDVTLFNELLALFYDGRPDPRTLAAISQ